MIHVNTSNQRFITRGFFKVNFYFVKHTTKYEIHGFKRRVKLVKN